MACSTIQLMKDCFPCPPWDEYQLISKLLQHCLHNSFLFQVMHLESRSRWWKRIMVYSSECFTLTTRYLNSWLKLISKKFLKWCSLAAHFIWEEKLFMQTVCYPIGSTSSFWKIKRESVKKHRIFHDNCGGKLVWKWFCFLFLWLNTTI